MKRLVPRRLESRMVRKRRQYTPRRVLWSACVGQRYFSKNSNTRYSTFFPSCSQYGLSSTWGLLLKSSLPPGCLLSPIRRPPSPFVTDSLKFRGLRCGSCLDAATKKMGHMIMRRSEESMAQNRSEQMGKKARRVVGVLATVGLESLSVASSNV